jgi:hypothetical protein
MIAPRRSMRYGRPLTFLGSSSLLVLVLVEPGDSPSRVPSAIR